MTEQLHVTRVLVGVDFDETSGAAVAAAGALAARFNATVTAVHAHPLDAPAYFTGAQMDTIEAERAESRARTAAEILAFAAHYTNAKVNALVEEGPPSEAILRIAPAFDLVVLGTHRLNGARRWWLGSVAEAVLRHATVPVLIVPAADAALPRSSS
jgi:nucleotide-binding universal stress UspA family protein